MINKFWLFFIFVGILVAAATGNMGKLTQVILDSAQRGVNLSLGLVAVLTFWLGMMKILEKSGLSALLLRPWA